MIGLSVQRNGAWWQVMPHDRKVDAFARDRSDVYGRTLACLPLLAHDPGLEHLVDRPVQTVGIGEHHPVKMTPLLLGERAGLQRLEIQLDRRNRRLQLVRDRVDERVVILVPFDFHDEEHGVDDDARDDQRECRDAEDERRNAAGVDDDPADIERHGRRHEQHAERHEECDRLTPRHLGPIVGQRSRVKGKVKG